MCHCRQKMKKQSIHSEILMFKFLLIILVLNVRGGPICPRGKYGDECEENCPEHCNRAPDQNSVHCDKASGSCSEGCEPGWYHAKCNKECSKNCFDNICTYQDGTCTTGCIDGKKGSFCEEDERETKEKEPTPDPFMIPFIFFLVVAVILAVGLVYILCRNIKEAETERLITGAETERLITGAETERLITATSGEDIEGCDVFDGSYWKPIADTKFHKACAEGDLVRVKCMTTDGSLDVNAPGSYGVTPVMWAAQKGHYDVVKHLVDNGADISCLDRFGDNMLNMACVGQSIEIVRFILTTDPAPDINRPRKDGRTPLMWSALQGNVDVFDYLKSEQADCLAMDNDGDNILHYACLGGHIEMVSHILSENIIDINRSDRYGRTALMEAAKYGHKLVFDLLLSKISDISHKDKEGNNILHVACRGGHVKIVERILSQGNFDINCKGHNGKTPLAFAAVRGHLDVFNLLMGNEANASFVCDDGNNILHVACIGGHVKMVKHILSRSMVDINSQREDGMTPLMLAARWGHKAVFDLLVNQEATVGSKGNTILHVASIGGHVEMVKHILSRSMVDINCQGEDGNTPLMLAARSERRAVFDFLVKKGANLFQVDKKGNNILHLACKMGSIDIVQHVLSQNRLDINARNSRGETASLIAKRKHHMDVFNYLSDCEKASLTGRH